VLNAYTAVAGTINSAVTTVPAKGTARLLFGGVLGTGAKTIVPKTWNGSAEASGTAVALPATMSEYDRYSVAITLNGATNEQATITCVQAQGVGQPNRSIPVLTPTSGLPSRQ